MAKLFHRYAKNRTVNPFQPEFSGVWCQVRGIPVLSLVLCKSCSRSYVAGGTPFMVTQEDFLVLQLVNLLICLLIHVFGGLRIVDCFHPSNLGIDVACAAQPLPRPPF